MNTTSYGLSIPALRGEQGGRTFYQCMVPNSVLNNFFPVNMEPEADRSQRTIDPKHAREITDYLVENGDGYLLGAITYAMDTEGIFSPVDGDDHIGTLMIPISANMRSLDGQHRRQGLKEAIDENSALADDYTSILIYVEPDLLVRRQMFSDMNATPKVVAKALNVSFDSRDPFARAAVTLANGHPLLRGHVEMQAARVRAASTDYFSLAGVYDAVKRLELGLVVPRGRPAHRDAEDLVEKGGMFFDLLQHARPEFARAENATLEEMKALRDSTILFSTTTLRAIAGGVHEAAKVRKTSDYALFTGALSRIDFRPDAEIFSETGFVSPGKTTPNARNQEVLAATLAIRDALLS